MPRAKGRQGTGKSSSNNALKKLIANIDENAAKRKVSMFKLKDFEEMYGVKYFISTGLPDLDLHLFSGERNLSGTRPMGWPTGRIVEICGDEGSFKTWITHSASARFRKAGGLVFLIQTENDFDLRFYRKFYDSVGLDFESEVEPFVRASMATTMGETINALKSILPKVREHYEQGGESIPVLIVLDSLAAMFSTADHDNFEADKDPKMGSHASEIHKMMKYIMEDLGRYNVCFMVTNQYRADMGPSRKTKKPAHDNAVRYYASLRLQTTAWGGKANERTSLGQDYLDTKQVKVKITKIRGETTGNNELELTYFVNRGFDKLGSLINAMQISGMIKPSKSSWEFTLNTETPVKYEQELHDFLDGAGKLKMGKGKTFRAFLKENKEWIPKIELIALARGPRKFGDEEEVMK